jgi:hypothetical protein
VNLLKYFRHKPTHTPRLSRAWPLDLPLVRFSTRPQDTWTLQDAFQGVLIMGENGSGKTSGSGKHFARKYLQNGFGGLVLCFKTDEADLWRSSAGCRIPRGKKQGKTSRRGLGRGLGKPAGAGSVGCRNARSLHGWGIDRLSRDRDREDKGYQPCFREAFSTERIPDDCRSAQMGNRQNTGATSRGVRSREFGVPPQSR